MPFCATVGIFPFTVFLALITYSVYVGISWCTKCHSCPPILLITFAINQPAATLSVSKLAFGTKNIPATGNAVFAYVAL